MTPVALAPEMAAVGIALGLLFSLICYLTTNLSPGGMITPGWLALTLVEDVRLAGMVACVTLLTYLCTRVMQNTMILYGKRLFAAVVMCGVLLQATLYLVLQNQFPTLFAHQTLGFIVPGLIAYQLVRQPPKATLMSTATVTLGAYVILAAGMLLGALPST
ncbi:poly-gamma-glutamate biosynthesis protein PgsC/CapC [Streptomyces inhibens]|uniref:poly-gamma-glutamate biosynthesis protein PgsC/CapC n=1 Tax=Streptomyces inhibens TaxID=2293571 RepID=UPI001EE73892|nr:poly-gamma-glutamate biosynthesis protein PgsC/CapC [Streptomyces inhibens]UKY53169.1 poly-gamma-glutamate biosynthesis protein PgsC/CapC [Streptomyces inhibens]